MEQQLIEEARGGDSQAFLELLRHYDRQIMSVVYRFTGDRYDREDLYQEVFLAAFKSIRTYRENAAFGTWLYRVALNRCIDFMRKKPISSEFEETSSGGINPEQRARMDSVLKALGKLKGPQRICFHLYYIEGWNIREIMDVMDCSEGTVKTHLSRARAKVKRDRGVLLWQTNLS